MFLILPAAPPGLTVGNPERSVTSGLREQICFFDKEFLWGMIVFVGLDLSLRILPTLSVALGQLPNNGAFQ